MLNWQHEGGLRLLLPPNLGVSDVINCEMGNISLVKFPKGCREPGDSRDRRHCLSQEVDTSRVNAPLRFSSCGGSAVSLYCWCYGRKTHVPQVGRLGQ